MRGNAARVVGGAFALTLLIVAVAPHGSVRADSAKPSTIARGMPDGAVAYLESDALDKALVAWRDSALRQAWEGSPADERMRRGMLFLRLAERVAALETIAGFELSIDDLVLLAGRRAGIAVYDLGETTFVFQAELASAELAKTPLAKAKSRFDTRKHAGLPYFIASDENGVELAFAFVGARLLASNDPRRLTSAMLLAAREEKVKTDGTAPGASLADDDRYSKILAAAPVDAAVRVWIDLGALRGTHHFDDFWIFGGKSPALAGIDTALLTLRLGGTGLVETRVYSYDDAALRPDAVALSSYPGGGKVGQVDPQRVTAQLPGVGLEERVVAARGADAAARIARLLPHGARESRRPPDAAARLADLIDAAAPGRMFETVALADAGQGRSRKTIPAERRHGAVVLRLADPSKLDAGAFEQAFLDYLRFVAADGSATPLAFRDAGGQRVLELPLVDDWALTIARPGGDKRYLLVATDPQLASRLTTELAKPSGLAPLLEVGAATTSRIELAALGRRWKAVADLLVVRENWYDTEHRELVVSVIPGAFDAISAAQAVVTVGYRVDPYYVEQVTYR